MTWPIDALHTAFSSGVTRIGAGLLNSVQSGVAGIYAGKSLTRVFVDGLGNRSGEAASGAIVAVGDITSRSGSITAGGGIGAGGAVVAGGKLISTAGGAAMDLRSGATVYSQHYIGRELVSGAVTANLFSISVTSGQAITAVIRGAGFERSGSIHHVVTFGASNTSGGNPTITTHAQSFGPQAIPSGYLVGGLATTAATNAVTVSVLGTSGRVTLFTAYADVTYAG
jgi:hypothetical protein